MAKSRPSRQQSTPPSLPPASGTPSDTPPPGQVSPHTWEKAVATAVAVLVVLLVGWLVVRNEPFADPNLVVILRVVLSVSAAILGATIPGFLQADWSLKGISIRAGGALALFVISYLLSPDVLQSPRPNVTGDGGHGKTGSPVVAHTPQEPKQPNPKQPEPKQPEPKQASTARVLATIKRYNIHNGIEGPPLPSTLGSYELGAFDATAYNDVAKSLEKVLLPNGAPKSQEVQFYIKGTHLTPSVPLFAMLNWRFNFPGQNPRPMKEISPKSPLDLVEAFQLTENYIPKRESDDQLRITLIDQAGLYRESQITIFENKGQANRFAFRSTGEQESRIALAPRKTRILLERPTVSGLSAPASGAYPDRILEAIGRAYAQHDILELSGFTRADLAAKRLEAQALPLSPGKINILDQFAVDFMVALTVLID